MADRSCAGRRQRILDDKDQQPRPETTLEALAKLKNARSGRMEESRRETRPASMTGLRRFLLMSREKAGS